jgi:hypothetical protein
MGWYPFAIAKYILDRDHDRRSRIYSIQRTTNDTGLGSEDLHESLLTQELWHDSVAKQPSLNRLEAFFFGPGVRLKGET